ncbi:uncharacterized protein N7482_008002 [Penicillium canariense]|uniref:Uncharacterized protein n=1 Tax=Penicillium canariense TaxID=189055 RepID=A0A9W9HT61_9EURO|nr:uncharacterized protein N7482_008002 [Penicillium canariense]KAJ5156902.1 hypothetical protein N7482_008002 [Penicillium canariense]
MDLSKRSIAEALVANSIDAGCFGVNSVGNREDAYGLTGGGIEQYTALKLSLWPTDIAREMNLGSQATQDYQLLAGYTYMSRTVTMAQ